MKIRILYTYLQKIIIAHSNEITFRLRRSWTPGVCGSEWVFLDFEWILTSFFLCGFLTSPQAAVALRRTRTRASRRRAVSVQRSPSQTLRACKAYRSMRFCLAADVQTLYRWWSKPKSTLFVVVLEWNKNWNKENYLLMLFVSWQQGVYMGATLASEVRLFVFKILT